MKDCNHLNKGTVMITQQHSLDAVKLPIVNEIPQQAGIGTKELEGEFSRSQLAMEFFSTIEYTRAESSVRILFGRALVGI